MRLGLAMALGVFATPVFAHPHVFIDAGSEVIFEAQAQAQARAVPVFEPAAGALVALV